MKTLFLAITLACISPSHETSQRINAGSLHEEEFYPDGYYYTNNRPKFDNWEFKWLSIFITPEANRENDVAVRFVNRKTSKWIDIKTQDFKITRDTTYIHFKNSHVGQITILGRFVCAKAPFDDRNVEAMKTIVFVGRIEINGIVKPFDLVWWEGD